MCRLWPRPSRTCWALPARAGGWARGRTWGLRPAPLPSAEEARKLLSLAVELGVTVFDTAPAYGASEALAGEFFRALTPVRRRCLTLAPKCGEPWDETPT